jgi:protein required for attachment to host cells
MTMTATLPVHIVVADEGEARFYAAERLDAALQLIGRLQNHGARLHDRDFNSDRPGRVFDRAPTATGRRGAVGRHAVGDEGARQPRKHQAQRFARRIVGELEKARREKRCARIVLMAEPAFLGLLRAALPETVRSIVVAEIAKDLVHQDEEAVQSHLPREAFRSAV